MSKNANKDLSEGPKAAHKIEKNQNFQNRKNSKCGNLLDEHNCQVSGLYLEQFSQKMYLKVNFLVFRK